MQWLPSGKISGLLTLAVLCVLVAACANDSSSGSGLLDGPPPEAFPATWQSVSAAPRHIIDYAFAASDPDVGYACASASGGLALFVTKDTGVTWAAGGALPQGAGSVCQLVVDDSDAAHLVLGLGAAAGNASIQIDAPRLLSQSRDGGRTWEALPALPGIEGSDSRNAVDSVAVLADRLLASVRLDTSPSPTAISAPSYALYALARGDHAWTRADQAFTSHQLMAGGLETAGSTVLVSAYPGADAPTAALPASVQLATQHATPSSPTVVRASLARQLSGPVPGAQVYRSTDAGGTWEHVSMPFTHPDLYGFVRSRDGSTYFGAGLDYGASGGLPYSTDSGATWSELPNTTSLRGLSGQPFTVGNGNAMIAAAPDGSVFAPLQLVSDAQRAGCGVLRIQPRFSGPRWLPVAHGPCMSTWHTTAIAGGVRLWGLLVTTPVDGGQLMYLDVPA